MKLIKLGMAMDWENFYYSSFPIVEESGINPPERFEGGQRIFIIGPIRWKLATVIAFDDSLKEVSVETGFVTEIVEIETIGNEKTQIRLTDKAFVINATKEWVDKTFQDAQKLTEVSYSSAPLNFHSKFPRRIDGWVLDQTGLDISIEPYLPGSLVRIRIFEFGCSVGSSFFEWSELLDFAICSREGYLKGERWVSGRSYGGVSSQDKLQTYLKKLKHTYSSTPAYYKWKKKPEPILTGAMERIIRLRFKTASIDLYYAGSEIIDAEIHRMFVEVLDHLKKTGLAPSPSKLSLTVQKVKFSKVLIPIHATYEGGTSFALVPGQEGRMVIQPRGIAFRPLDSETYWSKDLGELLGVQVGGEGVFTTGGGWIGGGFGVQGALKGAAFASAMNLLTTRVHNDCLIRFVFEDEDVTFQVISHTPSELEHELKGLELWLKNRLVKSTTEKELSPVVIQVKQDESVAMDLPGQLAKLAELFKSGVLSDDEYAAAKSKLLK
jgi:hypothetical protein